MGRLCYLVPCSTTFLNSITQDMDSSNSESASGRTTQLPPDALSLVITVCFFLALDLSIRITHFAAGSQKGGCICWAFIGVGIRRANFHNRNRVESQSSFFPSAVLGQRLMGFSRNKTLLCGTREYRGLISPLCKYLTSKIAVFTPFHFAQ